MRRKGDPMPQMARPFQKHHTKVVGAKGNKVGLKYNKECANTAKALAMAGLTNGELAAHFKVTPQTICNWINWHKEFREGLESGRVPATGEVAAAAFKAATGYDYEEVSTETNMLTGKAFRRTVTTKHKEPSAAFALRILACRRPQDWRDKTATELSGPGGRPLAGPGVIVITHEAMAAALPPPVDLPPGAVSVSPAAAPARLTVSREESPRTAQVAPERVSAPAPAQSAPGASWRKPERVAGGVAADRLPERQPVKASLDAGVADSLLGKLAALDNEIKE